MLHLIKKYDGSILMSGTEEECMSFEGYNEIEHIILPEEVYDDYIMSLQDAMESMVYE